MGNSNDPLINQDNATTGGVFNNMGNTNGGTANNAFYFASGETPAGSN